MIRVEALTGDALAAAIDDVAALRIEVFRAYPYLYDGDMDYERNYLSAYLDSDRAVVVGAFDGATLIGAATGMPMEDHDDAFGAPFAARGHRVEDIFYCAESVLRSSYRGHGIGHRFFDLREAHARCLGDTHTAFCGVQRKDHPARPDDYRPLDGFWRKRGYEKVEGVMATFHWKDLGAAEETPKSLQFWMRAL